ncbi:hypothetical protein SAMN04515647_1799 [Cohaesibacter sp. ES.047]|uniref:DUF2336 domain-containing protein n=1 Tax=Cohaesibacter sp. ES.047 TaxID=1798205 RepID=UPI000BB8F117|nr:DUF2336 domain-containing protein [Cohaesibacter sp. ES.047]SNY91571.1 hypothetical protein SAMN04515647_1799 [Cohaesibacter sp. ES.047]
MQAANPKTELVDWKVLSGQGDRGRSDELMRHVATLFSLTADHCTQEQIDTYDTVMQRLADLVGVETRSFAAKKICRLSNAPHEIIRRFAFDLISVADPVLRNSPVLTDIDLVEVSDEKGEEHMVSISMRKSLSVLVTDVLIRSKKGSVLIKLAANSDAEFSELGMSALKSAAANDQMLAHELVQRGQSGGDGRNHEAPKQIVPQGSVSLPELWQKIEPNVSQSMYDLSRHSYLGRYKFENSLWKAERFNKQGLLDKGILRQFACNDQFADLVCGIALVSGFPHEIVARMMSSVQWNQILSLFKLLGFSDRLVKDILECGPWLLCLSKNQCSAVIRQYVSLTVEEARSQALLWSRDGLLLD